MGSRWGVVIICIAARTKGTLYATSSSVIGQATNRSGRVKGSVKSGYLSRPTGLFEDRIAALSCYNRDAAFHDL